MQLIFLKIAEVQRDRWDLISKKSVLFIKKASLFTEKSVLFIKKLIQFFSLHRIFKHCPSLDLLPDFRQFP
jgi:hypothetical protein